MPLFGKKIKFPEIGQGFRKVRSFEQLHGPVSPIPRLTQWLADTNGGGKTPPCNRTLGQITEYLECYRNVTEKWDRVAMLAQLYFLTDRWLRDANLSAGVNDLQQIGRPAAVQNLFRAAVQELCRELTCTVNYLPQLLENLWGRVMTAYGVKIDQAPKGVVYLNRARAELLRLRFDINGLAWQCTWWARDKTQLVLVDSANFTGTAAPRRKPIEPGFAGYALSMGRDFYMGEHRNGFKDGKDFYHSAYLAGGPALCTGTMKIVQGRVRMVTNESGHYMPRIENLVNVVQALQMYGVPPATYGVQAMKESWYDRNGQRGLTSLTMRGDKFLQKYFLGEAILERYEQNRKNITKRGGEQFLA
jgi:hypothetical protein